MNDHRSETARATVDTQAASGGHGSARRTARTRAGRRFASGWRSGAMPAMTHFLIEAIP